MRIGFGNDIHKLQEGRPLYIGGLPIPHTKGSIAHSDGDVLLHALIDAILGALALGDIGAFFPPDDDKYKDADSRSLLEYVLENTNPKFINIDSTITLEGFKLQPYIYKIRKYVAELCSIGIEQVSIKAKTNEGLGEIGKGNAIKAEVVVLLESK